MKRELIHFRQIEACAYVCEDGTWEMEVGLKDRKTRTFEGGARDHPAGEPIHGMRLWCRLSVEGTVTEAAALMSSVPFEVTCRSAQDDYQQLVGLNVFERFTAHLRERLGARAGCHHLSMLAGMLPTLVIQSFAGVVAPVRDDPAATESPSTLDGCRGLRKDGEAVRLYWPRWYEDPGLD